jgi:dTDP-4-amino-4,6-dideoxygalactose transaminase
VKVPFANLQAISAQVRDASLAALTRVYDSGNYILGPEVAAFERECQAWFTPDSSCIGVSNGTDALVCSLRALGIGPGDRVLTTPLTFFATVSAILAVGATPTFIDVCETSFLIEPALLTGPSPDAVVAVHLFGRVADIAGWRCALPGVAIVEDAAQAWGGVGDTGPAGTLGDVACFSFFPAKPLGACGDAGLIVTKDPALAARCRTLRVHGRAAEGVFENVGGNYRLDELQAALLRVRLPLVEQWESQRRNNARVYLGELADLPALILPSPDTATATSAWSVFALRVPKHRDRLRRYLAEKGIGTAVYYPTPVHLQPALHGAWELGRFPVAERLSSELLALPIGPELDELDLAYVCDVVQRFFRG